METHSKPIFSIAICILFLLCKPTEESTNPETNQKVEADPAWMSAPHIEEIEPGIIYERSENTDESTYLKYKIDPRKIAFEKVAPVAKEIKKALETRNMELLTENSDSNIYDLIATKLEIEDPKKVPKIWLTKFKESNQDPYCDYHILMDKKINKIEIKAFEPEKPYIDKDFNRVSALYAVAFIDEEERSNFLYLRVTYINKGKKSFLFYYIEGFDTHCPAPNLEEGYQE